MRNTVNYALIEFDYFNEIEKRKMLLMSYRTKDNTCTLEDLDFIIEIET